MEILAIIPARKNSKGISLKNIQKLNGTPLLEYTIKAAKNSKKISRIILTTDSEEFADIGKKLKVEVPFIRPKKLATDNASSLDVVNHVLTFLKKNENYQPDIILILQVTSPLRTSLTIDKSINLLKKTNSTSVLGVSEIKQNPSLAFILQNNNFLKPFNKNFKSFKQRQKLPKFYYPTGSIYTFWRKTLETSGNFYGSKINSLIIPNEESIDVDDIFDLFICENILKNWKNYKKTFLKRSVKV